MIALQCQLSFPASGLFHSIFQYFKDIGKLSQTRRPSRPIIIDIRNYTIYIVIKLIVLREGAGHNDPFMLIKRKV